MIIVNENRSLEGRILELERRVDELNIKMNVLLKIYIDEVFSNEIFE